MLNGLYIVSKLSLKESTAPTQWKISRGKEMLCSYKPEVIDAGCSLGTMGCM